jgi:splicing factor 3B subunit 1
MMNREAVASAVSTSAALDELFPSIGYRVVFTNDEFLRTIESAESNDASGTQASVGEGAGAGQVLNAEGEVDENALPNLLRDIATGSSQVRKPAIRRVLKKIGSGKEDAQAEFFKAIIPMLMAPSIDDQERHWLMRILGRVVEELGSRIRPHVKKILVVVQPMLIDKDHYARLEASEIISNLTKSAGLATIIARLRPDIDNADPYVRDTTARALAVVGQTLGIPAILPFIRAVCMSKKSWQAQHSGILVVRHLAVLMGCAVLPYLKQLVACVEGGLLNREISIRTVTALSLGSLAQASYPYGFDSFSASVVTLWKGIRLYRGKGLVAFLKALGFIIPLMDTELAVQNAKEVIPVIIPHFNSHDDTMKLAVLQVLRKCLDTEGVTVAFTRSDIVPAFLKYFWTRQIALDVKLAGEVAETTVRIARTVGTEDMLPKISPMMKDENEPLRLMAAIAMKDILESGEYSGVNESIEMQMVDGALYAFQEQKMRSTKRYDGTLMLSAVEKIISTLGQRAKPYLPQLNRIITWRLRSEDMNVRMQAADLISVIAPVIGECEDAEMLKTLGQILYEYHGEEYPEVLGSILKAMNSVISQMDLSDFDPPIGEVVQTLTPIFRNRHEKVQENCIRVIGCIADRESACVPPREWMRVCIELTELLKAKRKSIRRAAVRTFGQIAQAIGPQDVLYTLLRNLKNEDRQNRVATTVAIAIVAESCGPYTVLPAMMNEYRIPENNLQNGVLKTLSFLFEYIGEMGKEYIGAILSLLIDALSHKDAVHRQIASTATKHLTLDVEGLGCEDMLLHLLNHLWPNIYEQSPHVIKAVHEGISGLRTSLGAGRIFQYAAAGLFHPARKVRAAHWGIYNDLHRYAADQLVMYYPSFEENKVRGIKVSNEDGTGRDFGKRRGKYSRDVSCMFI